ncbi:MAG: hypothetical protein J5709_11340 [Bacteroidales bacterium]|nr:hypothetical protein [Bacteroidales bacterium]
MKKTNLLLLIVIVILIGVSIAIFFVRNYDPQRTLRDFAVEDTASITKIFLANKQGSAVTLERVDDHWTVNQQYTARRDFVNNLLTTIKKVEVSSPVSSAKLERVMKDLAVQGIKVEIYQGDECVKVYYVGGVTEDNNGAYMILENSDLPFIVSRPGFTGYLTVHYLPELSEWRERIAFNYSIEDIAKVYVEYPDRDESFIAERLGENSYNLRNIDGSKIEEPFDTLRVKEFVSRIKFVGFETFILDSLQAQKRDSLQTTQMLASFTIEDKTGAKNKLVTYRHPNSTGLFDPEGNLFEYDVDNLYGILGNGEVVILQYPIIDPITFYKSDFTKGMHRSTTIIKDVETP